MLPGRKLVYSLLVIKLRFLFYDISDFSSFEILEDFFFLLLRTLELFAF
jgi:hypothetical protein